MSYNNSHPETMQAVFLDSAGEKLLVKTVSVPSPGPGEVLIKMSAAPVNPSDLASLKNAPSGADLSLFIPGLEGSGLVVATGRGLLPRLWKGKRVACSPQYHTSGTWAEYMVTKAGSCFPLGRRVSDEQGSMSLVNPLTALAFFETAREGKHRAIINNAASSALGRMIELLGNRYRIPVINIVWKREQAEALRKAGSRHVLESTSESFIPDLGSLAAELGATLLLDSVCGSQLEKMCNVLPFGSSVILYGTLSHEESVSLRTRTVIYNDLKISGFYLGNRFRANGLLKNTRNLMKVRSLMSSDLKINIRGRFPLSKAQEAVDAYVENMSAGKILLVMNNK